MLVVDAESVAVLSATSKEAVGELVDTSLRTATSAAEIADAGRRRGMYLQGVTRARLSALDFNAQAGRLVFQRKKAAGELSAPVVLRGPGEDIRHVVRLLAGAGAVENRISSLEWLTDRSPLLLKTMAAAVVGLLLGP